VYRIVIVSHRVTGSPGAVGATPANGPITSSEWQAAEAYAAALEGRAPKGTKVELVDRLKSKAETLQLIIDQGLLSAPVVLVFRHTAGAPPLLVARWKYFPATSDVLGVVI